VQIDIVSLFPEYFTVPCATGVVGRAVQEGRVRIAVTNPRDFTDDRHRTVDDYPYGGGAGMILKAPPFVDAVESLVGRGNPNHVPVVLLSPRGARFDQARAHAMAAWPHWVLVCGRYKAIDERFRQLVVTHELSVGDFVLSGGEPAALVVLDAVARLVPGVLGDEDSAETDSFGPDGSGGLDCDYYTRPPEYRGLRVPEVLLSGHHARIARSRLEESAARTRARRPDLDPGNRSASAAADAGKSNVSSWRQTG